MTVILKNIISKKFFSLIAIISITFIIFTEISSAFETSIYYRGSYYPHFETYEGLYGIGFGYQNIFLNVSGYFISTDDNKYENIDRISGGNFISGYQWIYGFLLLKHGIGCDRYTFYKEEAYGYTRKIGTYNHFILYNALVLKDSDSRLGVEFNHELRIGRNNDEAYYHNTIGAGIIYYIARPDIKHDYQVKLPTWLYDENKTNNIPFLEFNIENGLPYLLQIGISSSPFDNIFIEANVASSILLNAGRILAGYQKFINSETFFRIGAGYVSGSTSNLNSSSSWTGFCLSAIYMKYYSGTARIGWKTSFTIDFGYKGYGSSYPRPWHDKIHSVIPSFQIGVFFRIL